MNLKAALYDWGGANEWLFHALNDWRGPALDRVMWVGTRVADHALFPVYLTLISLSAVLLVGRARRFDPRRGDALARRWIGTLSVLCTAYLLDAALIVGAKDWFDFPRPLLALPSGQVHVVGGAEYFRGLPSGHASFSMLIAAGLWPMLGLRGRLGAVALVAWVGVSRVNVGAHFPADVVAAWLTALPIVWVVRHIVQAILGDLRATRARLSVYRSKSTWSREQPDLPARNNHEAMPP